MAFPVIAASIGDQEYAYGTATWSPSLAGLGAASGDLLIAILGSNVGAQRNYPAPSGWTQLQHVFGNSSFEGYVYYKVAAGSDTFNLVKTGGGSSCAAVFYRITGAAATPLIASSSSQSYAAADTPAVTPAWGTDDYLWISAVHIDKTSVTAYPAGYSLGQITANTASVTDLVAAAGRQFRASSEDPGAWTFDSVPYVQCFTIAVRPDVVADTTPPTLTSPTGSGGALVCSGSVTTDEDNGTLYAVATGSATSPSAAQVKLGQDHTGAAALRVVSQAVSGTGVQTVASGAVTAGTRYWHYMHEDVAANQSTVSSSASFVVTAAADTTPPTLSGSITIGTVTANSIQMSWPAGADNVAVTSYEVSSNGGSSYADVGSVLTYNVTGLAASTAYSLRVRAKDAAGNVSAPALAITQSTSAAGATLTSSALKNNSGTLLTSAAAEAYVSNPSTGALVIKKTGLTSNGSTGVITFTDAALSGGTTYRVVWRLTATGAEGLETLTAA